MAAMPTMFLSSKISIPWIARIKNTGELTVFNKAGAWADSVNKAIGTFNSLPFNVGLEAIRDEKAANIVVLLASGPMHYLYDDGIHAKTTIQTKPDFQFDNYHGQTSTLAEAPVSNKAAKVRTQQIFFAAIFLPGRVPKATKGQKEVIIVHEFIHACGVTEHEKTPDGGIMYDIMKTSNGGLMEATDQGIAMPPIRVGPQTLTRMQTVWPVDRLRGFNISF